MTDHTDEELIELWRKPYGGRYTLSSYVSIEELRAFSHALRQQDLARMAMMREAFIEYMNDPDAEPKYYANVLSATAQTAAAYVAEVAARALEEATQACEMVRYSRTMQGNTIGFNAIGDCIDKLHGMAAEKRKQAEEGKTE